MFQTIQPKTLPKNAYLNMLHDVLIDFYDLNEENIKDLQNIKFIIINFTEDQVNEIYEFGFRSDVCKSIQEMFPNSILDFVGEDGMYVIPKKK